MIYMPSKEAVYKIIKTRYRTGQTYEQVGTLEELIKAYSYTLECGQSWEHEKGNKKINRNPKTIKLLVKNIEAATTNSAANGDSGFGFEFEVVEEKTVEKVSKKTSKKEEVKEEPIKEFVKPECKLVGADGNVFNIIGLVSQSLKRAGYYDKSKEFIAKATSSESYYAVLALCSDYVEVK